MPKENKKRGRREEHRKRKRDVAEDEGSHKKQKSSPAEAGFVPPGEGRDDATAGAPPVGEMPFYGMLDEAEQEYFKRADEMLELNQFDGPDERDLFLANVYREADGKELKIANSQSCSRLMERLILLSSPAQLKALFQKFSGHFLPLVQHRFASHCCEALFLQAAPVVSQELSSPPAAPEKPDPNEIFVTMENLFLYAIAELEGNLGYLMTDRFASHAVRVLLLVLSGLPLSQANRRTLLQSKRKENVGVYGAPQVNGDATSGDRAVPSSFGEALEKVIASSAAGLDTTYLRALATHQTGNPTLQLLLRLELSHFGKQRAKDEASILHRLIPDDPLVEDCESAKFINGLLFDPVGSRLLETIVESAPSKTFKAVYRICFRPRLGALARNEVAGYVVSKVLERLGQDDLAEAAELIAPETARLAERSRFAVLKTLVERCVAREVDTGPLAKQLEKALGGANGFEIARLLKMGGEQAAENGVPAADTAPQTQPDRVHGSLLAQAMIAAPGPLSTLIFDSLVRLGTPLALKVARDPTASRTLQAALTSPNASIIFRRKMIQQCYGHAAEMALDPSASHVADAIWEGTRGLAFIRERIAEELAENEGALRESFVGRKVWRNWQMDLYKRRREDWVRQARANAGNDGFMSFPNEKSDDSGSGAGGDGSGQKLGRHLKAIELARLKHAADKARKERVAKRSKRKRGKDSETPGSTPREEEQQLHNQTGGEV